MEILRKGVCPKYKLECGWCGTVLLAKQTEMEVVSESVSRQKRLKTHCPVCHEELYTDTAQALR